MLLPLPLSPQDFNDKILSVALRYLPTHLDSLPARVLTTALCLQESGLKVRYQELKGSTPAKPIKGPARGLPQFERGSMSKGGGVWGVYRHRASIEGVRLLCRERDCAFEPWSIWSQLEHDDVLAAGMARLLLWTDPKPLPAIGDEEGAWAYYLRTWNPGKPHRDRWAENYPKAVEALT